MPQRSPDARLDALIKQALRPGDSPAEAPEFDDAELMAWRAGDLEADHAADLEARLALSAEGRALALGLADPPNDFHLIQAQRAALKATQTTAAPRRTWRLALAAAVLAGLGGLWLLKGAQAPPAYLAGGLEGGAAQLRGAQEQAKVALFYPSSTLRITLRPQAAQVAPTVTVLLARDGGPLKLAQGWSQRALGKGALQIEAPARGLFAEGFGAWQVHIILGESTGFEGRTAMQARAAHRDTWWSSHTVRYAPEPEDPKP